MSDKLHLVIIIVVALTAAACVGVFALVPEGESQSQGEAAPASAVKPLRAHPEQPVELGDVAWERDFEAGLAESGRTGKPALVLFDEVPGCSTVIGFGEKVLSHPLIVEAAETHFVPVAVYNNVGGKDREILESFGEPTWNNPVVRIIDAERKPAAKRHAGDYSVGGMAANMIAALESSDRPVPEYLRLLALEDQAARKGTEKATFGMYCFWTGEAKLGRVPGVVSTRTGFLHGREVVEVNYDPNALDYSDLVSYAKESGAGDSVFTHSARQKNDAAKVYATATAEAKDPMRHSIKDDKYNLKHSSWAGVPMTATQASRANALVASRKDPSDLFSERQKAFHRLVKAHPGAGWAKEPGGEDLVSAFARAEAIAAKLVGGGGVKVAAP